MSQELLIGFSEIDITPPAPVFLLGQYETRISTYVESPLLASVMALTRGDEAVIMCALDLVEIKQGFTDLVRAKLKAQAADLPVAKIIFSATHTHTGPSYYPEAETLHLAADFLPAGCSFAATEEEIPADVWPEDKCCAYISDKICQAVISAWQGRQKGYLAPAFGRAVTGHCRRVVYDDLSARMYRSTSSVNFLGFESTSDSGIELLYAFDADKKPIGALVNVVCPSQVVESECYISSDYWGKARDKIKAKLGQGFTVLGLCGAAGDQSPHDLMRPAASNKRATEPRMDSLAGAIELGRRVAGAVLDNYQIALAGARADLELKHQVMLLDLPLRRVTSQEYEAARQAFADYVQKANKQVFDLRDIINLHPYAGILDRQRLQEKTLVYPSEVHVVRIGNIALASNPFELYLDYGNQIKGLSPADQTFIVQLACDCAGYLPTKRAEAGGNYSAYVSSGYLGSAAGDLLVRQTVASIRNMWEEDNE